MAFSRRGRPLAEEEKSTDAAKARARAMELLAGQELSSGQLYERLGRRFTQPTAPLWWPRWWSGSMWTTSAMP